MDFRLVADVTAYLPAFREIAESLMFETVEVGVWSEVVDPDTLITTKTLTTEHYSGSGRIKYPTLTVSEGSPAGQQVASADVVLKVPVGAGAGIRPGDLVKVTGSSVDVSLVGRWFRVKAWPQAGAVTAHRYPLDEES